MTRNTQIPHGRIRVAWHIDFSDPDEFADAIHQIAEATGQVESTPNGRTQAKITTGRYLLSEEEWEQRFQIVRRIIRMRSEEGITFEQACQREGIACSTFRYWRQKMRERKGEK